MAPLTRRNSALARKIANLELTLAPLVPLPSGPPHPAFPKTLLAFHLLTEDELDSIAHYYHQSTPGIWSNHYPANMNWDKEFLAQPNPKSPRNKRRSRRINPAELSGIAELLEVIQDMHNPTLKSKASPASEAGSSTNPYAGLSDRDRIRIKRRKVGKFIGLVGMETPVEEIAGRIQASMDRAIQRSREEMRRVEEYSTRRRKML